MRAPPPPPPLLLLLALLAGPPAGTAGEPAKADPDHPYRTDSANEHLPWYRLKAGEFPPRGAGHRVAGDLVEADFIHRSGQFRTAGTGELVDFTLPPSGTILYLNAEADLRDVPLGTTCQFFLFQDEAGAFTRVAAMQDEFTTLAGQGASYRLDEVRLAEGKLGVTGQSPTRKQLDPGRGELLVDEQTRIWKGDKPGRLGDLAAGDDLLVNLTGGGPPGRARCTDVWAGAEAPRLATEQQRKRHNAFIRERGLAARIDGVEGRKLAVALIGDPASLRALFQADGIVPGLWAAEHRSVDAVVANEELRTYNPPVDRKRSPVLESREIPTDGYGCGGVRWTVEPELLLEGFRKGRIIRLFAHPAWPVKDMPFGESLYTEAPGAKTLAEEPEQYPYRTDFANEDLPWYRPKPGEFPPFHSHHLVTGELVKVDVPHRSGRLRADRTGDLIDFRLPPFATILYLNAEADLRDLPLGTRYRFFLHQDDRGAFTKATVITDDFTDLAGDDLTYRLEEAKLGEGKLLLAVQHAAVKNEKEEMVLPPAFGRGEFAVDGGTRVWKGDKPAKLADLVPGDDLLLNRTGRTATGRGVCTEIWAGVAAHKLVTDRRRTQHEAALKGRGLPAWIDAVEGNKLTVTFFSGSRKEFPRLLGDDPWGKGVTAIAVDEDLRPLGEPPEPMGFANHIPEGATAGTYGCSGVRWVLEAKQPAGRHRPGQILRIFKEGWPIQVAPDEAPRQP